MATASINIFLRGRVVSVFFFFFIRIANIKIIHPGYCLKVLKRGITKVVCIVPEKSKLVARALNGSIRNNKKPSNKMEEKSLELVIWKKQ